MCYPTRPPPSPIILRTSNLLCKMRAEATQLRRLPSSEAALGCETCRASKRPQKRDLKRDLKTETSKKRPQNRDLKRETSKKRPQKRGLKRETSKKRPQKRDLNKETSIKRPQKRDLKRETSKRDPKRGAPKKRPLASCGRGAHRATSAGAAPGCPCPPQWSERRACRAATSASRSWEGGIFSEIKLWAALGI